MSTATVTKTPTSPARKPDGFPMSHGRYRSYTLFALTSVFMGIGLIQIVRGLGALGAGPEAWDAYRASLGGPAALLGLVVFLFTAYFAIRWGWIGRKILVGRVGPVPGPPVPMPALGGAVVSAAGLVSLLVLLALGGVL